MAKGNGTTKSVGSKGASKSRTTVNTSVKIAGKTFKFVNGVATVSMYDKQERITKLAKYAKEHGLGYKLLEGNGKVFYK